MITIAGLFETRAEAERAIEALRGAGFRAEEISLVLRDRREAEALATEAGTGDAAGAGAIGGGALGGAVGLLAGFTALTVPDVGPVLAFGPIATAVAGGAFGVATGGILGALTDLGIPEEEARHSQTGIERGGILVTVTTSEDRESEARALVLS